jgi:hypothetical protein
MVLLLQNGLDVPEQFRDRAREYLRFDRDSPSEAFATAVESVKRQLSR